MNDLFNELTELYEKLSQEKHPSSYTEGYLDALDYVLQALEVYLA